MAKPIFLAQLGAMRTPEQQTEMRDMLIRSLPDWHVIVTHDRFGGEDKYQALSDYHAIVDEVKEMKKQLLEKWPTP